jgi:hypothetical protein
MLPEGMKVMSLTFPGWEVRSLEQCMFQNTLNTPQRCNDINTVVVELPQFAIMPL